MIAYDLRAGDCVAGMRGLPAASVDIVVTSPPYNLGIRYSGYDDAKPRKRYLAWCCEWAREVKRVLTGGGSLFLNIGAAPANPMLPHEIAVAFREIFVLQNAIHWIKSIALPNEQGGWLARGHFKPINSRRFLNDCHEYIFHFTCAGDVELDRLALGVPYQDKSNIARWAHTGGSDKRCRGNTWFIPYQTIKSRDKQRPHPATFPVELAENCIRLHGLSRVKRILDPFLGIGNSAVAALRCGVANFIGFDVDESYVREARRRLESARGSGEVSEGSLGL
jgi:site-specific DNA-methyltransferase (adenine-specific)